MSNLETCLKILDDNNLSDYAEHVQKLSEDDQAYFLKVLQSVMEEDKLLVSGVSVHNLLRMMVTPEEKEKNKATLTHVIEHVNKVRANSRSYHLNNIFASIEYIQQISAASDVKSFDQYINNIMSHPKYAREIALAYEKIMKANATSDIPAHILRYADRIIAFPQKAVSIANAIISLKQSDGIIRTAGARFMDQDCELEYCSSIFAKPEFAESMAEGFYRLISNANKSRCFPKLTDNDIFFLMELDRAGADSIAAACLIAQSTCEMFQYINFMRQLKESFLNVNVTFTDVRYVGFLRGMNADSAYCVLGKIYSGRINAPGVSVDIDKAEVLFRQVRNKNSTWYLPSQAGLFDALFPCVNTSIRNPEPDSDEYKFRQELVEIKSRLDVCGHKDYMGADIDNISLETAAQFSGSLMLFNQANPAYLGKNKCVGTQTDFTPSL